MNLNILMVLREKNFCFLINRQNFGLIFSIDIAIAIFKSVH